ncbi:MAG: glycosyltransferase family 4 protein [bacterium]|nr:glycosyltransferase family 4 protein [bacterium]
MRWQDKNPSFLRLILSWVVNALSYPRKDYQYFLVDNLHMSPVLMKKLGLLRSDQKIIVHMGSHTLYFIYSNWFSGMSNKLQRFMLKNYDAIICEGEMAQKLVTKILEHDAPPTYVTFLGPPAERASQLTKIQPDLSSKEILLISHGPIGFRKHYKGLDIMCRAFGLALENDPTMQFRIVGDWEDQVVSECYDLLPEKFRKNLHFTGKVDDINRYLQQASLYLHCSRGDAFPTSSIEAMTAGLVPIVSEWTGTMQVVKEINEDLIVPLDPKIIAERINWYFDLSLDLKKELSEKAKEAVRNYTEEAAVNHYQVVFDQIIKNFSSTKNQTASSLPK